MERFLSYILITAVLGTVFAPAVAGAASTNEISVFDAQSPGFSWSNCLPDLPGPDVDSSDNFDFTKCVALISFNVLFRPTAVILWLSGQIFNGSIHFSLDKAVFDSDLIVNGWKTTRDFANMFFIFILLYIAIATILQLGGYGIKDLLVKVLIIALLVNFSLLITKVIIDASNVLAWEFYNNMTTEGGTVTTKLFGKGARDISSVFIAGFNPQNLLSTKSFEDWQGIEGEDIAIIVLFLCGALMNLVAAFVLFAGAIFFVIRIAVLWLIMMLAPLAFLAMALPAAKGYAKQWWDKLFNQSFFAPAFLFLLYLVSKLVRGVPSNAAGEQKGILAVIFESMEENSRGLSGIEGFLASLLVILIHFVVMVTLMVGSLIIAKQLGAYGSGAVMKWGDSARKWGQGYAGRVSKRYIGRAATAAGGALEKERESKIGRGFAKTIKSVPFLQRGIAGVAQLKKKEVGRYEKQYAGLDAKTLEQLKGKFGTTTEARMAMENIIKKKNAQAAKKEDVNEENKKYEKIEKELPKMEEWNKADKTRKIEIDVALEANKVEMQKNPSEEVNKKRAQFLVEKEQLDERMKEINQMREEKKKIEENRTRRREMEGLEEGVAEAKAMAGEARKPKETGPEKT